MARPIKEGLDYFPHDTDATNDEKIEVLRSLYGNDGYAFYFILLERIYRTPDAKLDISDPEIIEVLARKILITAEKFNEILSTALKWGCFDKNTFANAHILTSNGIKKRAEVVLDKRKAQRDKYQKEDSAQKDGTDKKDDPEKYVKGKYGHMVQR